MEPSGMRAPRRRGFPQIVGALMLIGLLVLIGLFWPTSWSPGRLAIISLVDRLADYVLANVDQPLDFELPVTHASYRSEPRTAAVIGGRGHGLDCSLPWYGPYFFRQRDKVAPVAFRFRQACAFHDLCYRHGLATYGYVQNDC